MFNSWKCLDSYSLLSMVLSMTIRILLLVNLFNSSACFQGINKLTYEEPSAHNATGNLPKIENVITGEVLAGYYSDVQYTDATCSVIRYAESYALNACTPWIDGNSFRVSANSTHKATFLYSDFSCETLLRPYVESYSLQVCGNTYKTLSVTASYSTITSTAPLLSVW